MIASLPIRLLMVLAAFAAACSRAPEPAPAAAEPPSATHATLVEREAAFAAAAREHGVKAAFLEFLDEESIVLQPGPVWGRAAWTAREEVPATLEWLPDLAQLSAAGDSGYTTGPWLLTPTDASAEPAEGRYLSVWQKSAAGWRVLFDGGFGRAPAGACLAANAVLFHQPSVEGARNETDRAAALGGLPATLQYWPMGAGIATSGDMGYSYGLSAPAASASADAAYVHIWCRQADGWRLAVQLRTNLPPR